MGSVDGSKTGTETELDRLLARQEALRLRVGDGVIGSSGISGDLAEMAIDEASSDLEAKLHELDREKLQNVVDAIAALRAGVAGICEDCGGKIPKERIKALEGFARTCISCALQRDRKNGPSSNGSSREHWSLVSDGKDGPDHLAESDMVDN